MRVLRVITRMNIGGPSIHAGLLSTRLDPARFSTWLAVGEPDATEGDMSQTVAHPCVQLVRIRTLKRPIRPWADLITLVRLCRLMRRVRPDVVHTHMAKAGMLGRTAAWLYNHVGPGRRPGARVKVVHTYHGHVLDGYFSAWLSRVFLAIERALATQSDVLIAVSPAVRDDLLRQGIGHPAQWRVIPLGLDLQPFLDMPLRNGAPVIRLGLVGRLVPIKNPGLFLEVVHRLHAQPGSVAIEALIVGDGPLRGALEAHSRQRGLESVVTFTGWQRPVHRVYEGVDIVCLTSWNEGTPLALIEAMAAGRPVIATDVGGVRDVLEASGADPVAPGQFQTVSAGFLVRPGDVEGLAAALRAMAADGPLRARLGQAARQSVAARFSAERLLGDIAGLYTSMEAA